MFKKHKNLLETAENKGLQEGIKQRKYAQNILQNFLEDGHMLKGVNRRIIEINNTESEFFERAIVFVKPNFNGLDKSVLEREADGYVKLLYSGGAGFLRREARKRRLKRRCFLLRQLLL